MSEVLQSQVDAIEKIQYEYNVLKTQSVDSPRAVLLGLSATIPGCERVPEAVRATWLIEDASNLIGLDTIAILRHLHHIDKSAPLTLSHIELGGCLLGDAAGVIFDHVDLQHSHIHHATTAASVTGRSEHLTDFTRAVFKRCRLTDMLFKYVNLSETRFEHCELSGVKFFFCNLSNVAFHEAHFNRLPRFVNCTLTGSYVNTPVMECNRGQKWSLKTASSGALLVSASVIILGAIMLNLLPPIHVLALIGVGLFIAGTIISYLAFNTANSLARHAKQYAKFEHTVTALSKREG